MFKKYFLEIKESKYILLSLVKLDIKNQYRNSLLGMAWNFLSPLMLCLVIGIVYSVLFSVDLKEFIPYLFSGLTPWFFISNSSTGGCYAFLNAEGYIKQLNVPVNIYPVRVVLVNFINFVFSVIAYFALCLLLGVQVFTIYTFLIIPNSIILLIFSLTLANISGYLHTYFRDFAPINAIFLQAMFYVTPIIYPAERILETNFGWIVQYNPFYYFVTMIRSSMLGIPIESYMTYLISIIIVLLLLILICHLNKKVGRQIVHRI